MSFRPYKRKHDKNSKNNMPKNNKNDVEIYKLFIKKVLKFEI